MGQVKTIATVFEDLFQSTHPVWDGTPARQVQSLHHSYFNPPIPCGMGLLICHVPVAGDKISIHPSRVGWDDLLDVALCKSIKFQSTHPVWDGTLTVFHGRLLPDISIHPSRVGWDFKQITLIFNPWNISIHPSRVGWDARQCALWYIYTRFQSTHPVWDGT